MRGTFDFDPAQCSYGPASPAIQQILTEWMAIDWFVPPSPSAWDVATGSFEEHHQRARVHQPDLFPEELGITSAWGGWPEFVDLCVRVRTQQHWDWKFSQLELLSHRHSQARGWTMREAAPDVGPLGRGTGPGPGDLFFRVGELVLWNNLGPKLDLGSVLSPSDADTAYWYLGYATMDLLECVEWQLAERSDRLDGSPFWPLVRCHAAGFHAFSLGPAEVVLFGFVPDP